MTGRFRPVSRARTAALRGAMYFGFWLVLMPSARPSDLAIGLAVAMGAAWVSLRLLPPESGRLHFGVLVRLMPHFVWESIRAGIDVARRALAPRVPLNPGFVNCPIGFPPGLARNTFATITSLMPGTVPADDGNAVVVYHCLDIAQPVVEQLSEEQRLLAQALVAGKSHV